MGWSQVDLAIKSNVSERAIAGFESKGNKPSGTVLEKLALALSVSPSWLLGGDEVEKLNDAPAKKPSANSPFSWMEVSTLDNTLLDLVKRLQKAGAHERKHILGNITELVAELEQREIGRKQSEETNSAKVDDGIRHVLDFSAQGHGKTQSPLSNK